MTKKTTKKEAGAAAKVTDEEEAKEDVAVPVAKKRTKKAVEGEAKPKKEGEKGLEIVEGSIS